MSEIAVIGDKQSVMGFASLGIDAFTVEENNKLNRTIKDLADKGYSIIYITEKAYLSATEIIQKYKDDPTPAIIVIPSSYGSLGIGLREIRESAIRAVGSDILPN